MTKVLTMEPEQPKRKSWIIGLGVLCALAFIAVLVFLLLNFLGIISISSLRSTLPWHQSPAVKQELTEFEQLQREKRDLEADLAQLSSRMQDKDAEITALKSEIERLKIELEELAQKQESVTAMASVYGSMDPQAAAVILGKLPNEEVLSILGKLKKDQAAAILSSMDSQKASELTRDWVKGESEKVSNERR